MLSKLDVAIDLRGSFLPNGVGKAYDKIKDSLKVAIGQVFSSPETNFLSMYGLPQLTVVRGDNILDTCY